MKPIDFPQSDKLLTKPPSMTDEECSPLPVHCSSTHNAMISCWRPTWRERLAIFFGKPVWLWVIGHGHPPVSVEVQSPFDRK
jgi:hypothetical protein